MINTEKLSEEEKVQFYEYLNNHFTGCGETSEEYKQTLETWKLIAAEAEKGSAAEILNAKVIPSRPCSFIEPENISIEIYKAAAGEIPVIRIRNTEDFEAFTTNMIFKGVRPENISSTGASFVCGKRTRLIILSCKPYSNVSAKTLKLDEEVWKEKSMTVRLEHECTHFFTKTVFGTAMNHIHDELMADFFGLYEAFGEYRAEYFEYFMGIRGTEGTRLKCYIPECSEALLEVLKETASVCAEWLEKWSKTDEFLKLSKEQRLSFLCKLNLRDIIEP